ncbi:GNAT family N-acetyltransferase [Actinomadura macrotermitis]|uniref:Putative N-acetyltransferase n=1 Tax=Actinomadura macrotermitis TaxID=2585200 RepID=A0A7K0BWL3_9ACTN|nr:putative N-acetyltransferase [Actinomadura macrotermitis]
MTDLRIRPSRRDDDRTLAALARRTWSPVADVLPCPAPDQAFFDLGHPPEQFLVAERMGRVVGYVRLVRPRPDAADAHVRQIQGLAVDPAERRRGVARALLDAACDEAARQGARRVTLHVLAGNDPARRLYEASGFVVEGVLKEEFRIAGEYVDDVIMARAL